MKRLLKTIWIYAIGFKIAFIFLPYCYILSLFPYRYHRINRLYFFLTYWWNFLFLKCSFISFTITGKENLPCYPNQPSLLVMNHTSALDIPLGEYLAGSYPHIWISKKEYGKIPLFGRLLKRMHILIDKNNQRESARALLRLIAKAKIGKRHVLLFPEGTRSRTGELLPFEPGFAFLARKLNYPIIPINIHNASSILPPSAWIIDPSKASVHITIGQPIHIKPDESQEQLTTRVRSWFEKHGGQPL